MPIVFAFCGTAASVRFIAFATSTTGVLVFEWALSCRRSSHDLHVEAVRVGLAIDILDVARERLLLLFKALDPLDEGAQMLAAVPFGSVAFAIFIL